MMYRIDGTAAFVGLERVVGRIGDKSGSFVLQRTGAFEGGQAKESYAVIPGSATGDLRGLTGVGTSDVGHGMEHPFMLMYAIDNPESLVYYHGTKADLKTGDLIAPGYASNYGARKEASFVYLSATLDAAVWGAELAVGDGRGRIYIVEATGAIEDDPDLTNKRFPGNPTRSYRSRNPLRVIGEITDWEGHSPERLKEMRDHVAKSRERSGDATGG
jgi:rifampin ADP-ribosylating transferase